MQVAKTMIEKYLYEEVTRVFKKSVVEYSLSNAKEDIDTVYDNLKDVTEEITEEVVEAEALKYLTNSVLWIQDGVTNLWGKTDLVDIVNYIESNKGYVGNAMMEQLVGIIQEIDVLKSKNGDKDIDIDCEIL